MSRASRSALVFAALCAAGVVAIGLIVHDARTRVRTGQAVGAPAGPPVTGATERLYFRYAGGDASFGNLAHVDLGGPAPPVVHDLPCEVVHASGGKGICLAVDRGLTRPYVAKLFDLERHEVRATWPLGGVPSRTRVARSGRIGATTVFVTGHGYDSVDFSTETLLVDLASGAPIANVETFAFFAADGRPIREADFNVWGVTFPEGDDTFYATLSTAGRHLLVRGDIAAREARVIHEDVECPSVSPDGRRVAYKRRYLENGFVRWQLYVLDLATFAETPLAERRSVDDQLEWLDDGQVLYTLIDTTGTVGNSVWKIAADGSGTAERFLTGASSPAVAR